MLCLILLPALIFSQTNQPKKAPGLQELTEVPNEFKEKPIVDHSDKYVIPSGREGGEDIGNAMVIPALPFNDGGFTCDNLDDYDEACPYTGSTAPDVVYSYAPATDQLITIDLCGSLYDTKVFVYENVAGNTVGCNDDFYFGGSCGLYTSKIEDLPVTAGNTYYIVIAGFGNNCGDYLIEVTTPAPPPPCPPITAFPLIEDFEGTFLPDCWSKIVQSGNDIFKTDFTDHTTGSGYSAAFSSYGYSSDYNQYLFSPAFTVDDAFRILSFWHKKYGDYDELLEWGVSTTTNPDDFVWTPVDLTEDWQKTFVDLKPYVGQTVYVGFHYYGDYLYYVFLDDVQVAATPPIPISNWAIVAGILMIGAFLVFRYRRKLA